MTVADHLNKYLENYAPDAPLDLHFGDCPIRVIANNEALISALREYFEQFLGNSSRPDIVVHAIEAPEQILDMDFTIKMPDPGKSKIKEEFVDLPDGRVVRKRLTGMVMFFGESNNLVVGPCRANDNQVINFIINRYIERLINSGCLLFHAAGVSLGKAGLALSGFSGMGKSTLALHLMNRGTTFVSNDRLLGDVDNDGDIIQFGVPKLPRVNPGTLLNNAVLGDILSKERREQLSAMPTEELWGLEEKYDVSIKDYYSADRFKLKAPMRGLVVLNWRNGDGKTTMSRIDPAERRELLPAFMKSPGLFYEPLDFSPPDFSEEAYIQFLDGCPIYEITGDIDFDWAADACLEILNESANE